MGMKHAESSLSHTWTIHQMKGQRLRQNSEPIASRGTAVFQKPHGMLLTGGGGGELNSPSRKELPEYATGLVGFHNVA